MKTVTNPRYLNHQPFIDRLARDGFFDHNGTLLHDGRNTIRKFEDGGVTFAVKSYGHLTLFNRCIYGTLRKSKARRAYQHALRLRSLGIDTPEEVACLEIRKGGMLSRSYFVARHSDYLPLTDIVDLHTDAADKLLVLDALAAFLHRMHSMGILHKDLNISNILYQKTDDGYAFQLIDINRMQFRKRLSIRQKLRNLRRLACPTPAFLYLLDKYAVIDHSDINTIQLRGAVMRLVFDAWHRTRHRLKDLLKKL